MSTGRWYLTGGAILFCLSLAGRVALSVRYPKYYFTLVDLRVYRLAGKVAVHGGALYGKGWPGGLPYLYTPFSALLFAVTAGLNFHALEVLMTLVSIACVLITAWLALGLAGTRELVRRLAGTLLLGGVGLWLDPVAQTLSFGQVNLVLLALVIADFSLADGHRWKGAGVGLAAAIKLTPLVFAVYLLLTRRYRAFAVSLATFTATIAVGFIFLPSQSTRYWIDGAFYSAGHVGAGYGANQSLYGMILRLTHNAPAMHNVWLAAAACTVIAGLLLAAWAFRRGDELLGVTVCAITGLLISPISWDHHWVWALPAAVWAAARLPRALPSRLRLWPGGLPPASLATIAVLAVFAAVPRHPAIQWPDSGAPVDPDPLLRISGWIWSVPTTGKDGYYWSGTQILVGNLYVFAGVAFLLFTCVYLALLPEGASPPGAALEDLSPASTTHSLPT